MDERRRNPRLRAPSIIYAQLGSNNGGIVLNLGIDGVACQAAHKLNAERNTTLNLRLRGYGLNVELVGELVWLDATRKEAGISFKSLCTNVQKDIADWIAREAAACEIAALEDTSRLKAMPAMPGISAAGKKSVPHSLSAALALSRATSVDSPSSADAGANESCLPAPWVSATEIPGAWPLPEIVSSIRQDHVPADELDGHSQGRDTDSSASPVQSLVEEPLHNQPPSELSPIEQPHESPAGNSSAMVLPEEPMPPVSEGLPQASEERPGESEFYKTEEIEPIPQDGVSRPPDNLLEVTATERWIPPALLAAWRRGNRQHKCLLAGIGAASLFVFALILTLAVAQVDSSLGRSSGSGSLQQSTARAAASSVSVGSPRINPLQAPPALQTTDQPQSDQSQTSLLESFAETFLGYKPDPDIRAQIQIDKDHVGVQVWTSKSSGYYYCTDGPYYMTVRPGTFMSQRAALQSGYQPKLGQFCN